MTAKDKAKELVGRFKNRSIELGESHSQLLAEANAIIAVDLRLEGDFIFSSIEYGGEDSLEYWIEVKQEIEKL